MFVLLFGLMGVAAIFPVGNHYAGRGEQYDRGAAMADAAFGEIKARGLLRPDVWLYAQQPSNASLYMKNDARVIAASGGSAGLFNVTTLATMGPGHAFVLDPMGTAAAVAAGLGANPAPLTDIDVFPFAVYDSYNPQGVGTSGNAQAASNTANPWSTSVAGSPKLVGARFPLRRITVPSTNVLQPTMTPAVAEMMCRLHDDLSVSMPTADNQPGIQNWRTDPKATPEFTGDDAPLARQYTGSYSWLATIVPAVVTSDPTLWPMDSRMPNALRSLQPADVSYGNNLYDVSVAVFHKRQVLPSASSERCITAELNAGGELVIYAGASDVFTGADILDAALDGVRPGQWIALCGVHPRTGTSANGQFLLKWYRLLSLDDETDVTSPAGTVKSASGQVALRRATLDGPDWPAPTAALATSGSTSAPPVMNLRAIVLPGVIGVSTQRLRIGDLSSGQFVSQAYMAL
jgi:hypothetical protein